MGSMWLWLALLQIPQQTPPTLNVERPRFAVGGDIGAAMAVMGEGGGLVGGAGLRVTVPLGARSSINARIIHATPGFYGGMYELRWQRAVDWAGPFQPDYAGVGAVGFYWLDTGRYGVVRPSLAGVLPPQVLSLTAGWNRRITSRLTAPVELSAFAHPYGAVAAGFTAGLTWSPRPPR